MQHLSCVINNIDNLRLQLYKLKIVQDAQNTSTTNLPLADAQNTNKQEPSPETAPTTRSEVKESEETHQEICNKSDSNVKGT